MKVHAFLVAATLVLRGTIAKEQATHDVDAQVDRPY